MDGMDLFDDFTPAPASTEFVGIPLEEVDGVTRERLLPSFCQGCTLADDGTHKCFKAIGITAGQGSFTTATITRRNELANAIRQIQAEVEAMHICGAGMTSLNDTNLLESPTMNMTATTSWKLVAASGDLATLELEAGDSSPLEIYAPGTLRAEGMALPPAGKLYAGPNSWLAEHGGWPIVQLIVDTAATYTTGDQFQVRVRGNLGSIMTKFPTTNTDPIYATLEFYDVPEAWVEPEYVDAFRADMEPTVKTFAAVDYPGSQRFVLEANNAIVLPREGDGGRWFRAYEQDVDETWVDVTDQCTLELVHQNDTGVWSYESAVNFDHYQNPFSLAIKFEYYPYDAAGPVITGARHCGRLKWDYSASYGEAFGAMTCYCSAARLASGAGKFRPGCMQTDCSHWQMKTTWTPLRHALAQLTESHPWRIFVSNRGSIAQRLGAPSLVSLTGAIRPDELSANGNHALIDMTTGNGYWLQVEEAVDSLTRQYGLNTIRKDGASRDPLTWGGYGPGGNLWPKGSDYANETLDDVNDQQRCGRMMLMRSAQDFHVYDGSIMNAWAGYYQSFVASDVFAGRVPAGTGGNVRPECTIQRGYWNADHEECDVGEAVYFWRLDITSHLSSQKTKTTDPGGIREFSRPIYVDYTDTTGGARRLHLRPFPVTCSTFVSPGQERETTWLDGGTLVPVHESLRIMNWACAESVLGPQRHRIWPGMCVRFPEGEGYPAAIEGRRFWIKATEPYAGERATWIDFNQVVERVVGAGRVFMPFAANTESLVAVRCYRIPDAVTLTSLGGERPYPADETAPAGIAYDQFWFEEDYLEGVRGAWVYLSQANANASSLSRTISIEVQTDTTTYGLVEVDIKTDPVWGFDAVFPITITTAPNEAAAILTVTVIDRNGNSWALTPTTQPVLWSDFPLFGYVASISGTQITLTTHSQWAGDTIKIEYEPVTDAIPDEEQWYADNISFHDGLPSGHDEYGNMMPVLTLVDENGALAGLSLGDLQYKPIQITIDGAALPSGVEVRMNTYNSGAADTLLTGSQYEWWGAQGQLWGKVPLPAGGCVWVRASRASRNCWRLADEVNAFKWALEGLMS